MVTTWNKERKTSKFMDATDDRCQHNNDHPFLIPNLVASLSQSVSSGSSPRYRMLFTVAIIVTKLKCGDHVVVNESWVNMWLIASYLHVSSHATNKCFHN